MGHFNNKKPVAEHVYEDTVIWQCSSCNCWSRPEYVSEPEPNCPLCQSRMFQETKNIRIE